MNFALKNSDAGCMLKQLIWTNPFLLIMEKMENNNWDPKELVDYCLDLGENRLIMGIMVALFMLIMPRVEFLFFIKYRFAPEKL